MSEISREIRDLTVGHLEQRVIALEKKYSSKLDDLFGQKPWVVLSVVIGALSSAFWVYHTWQVERLDRLHSEEISRINSEHSEKMAWLKEQYNLRLKNQASKCQNQVEHLANKATACAENSITKPSNSK